MKKYRKEFPVTKNLVYLNHAGISPIPNRAKNKINAFVSSLNELGAKDFELRKNIVNNARDTGAKILGCKKSEVGFIKSTTHGIILCARGIPFKPGDNVIIPENEFPANVIPWLALRKKGVEVRFVKENQKRIAVDDINALIDENTKAVSVSYVEFSTGFRNDVKAIGELCNEKGIIFVVDAIQATGIIPFKASELGVDFMSMDSHKWLLGPEGIGYFYANENSIDKIENIFEGWLSMQNFFDFLNYEQPRKKDASKFEEGSLNFMGLCGMQASSALLLETGIENVYKHVQTLLDDFSDKIKSKGYELQSPREKESEKSGILCFHKPDQDMKKIYEKLAGQNVVAALRNGAIRISPHLYNTHEELEMVLDML